MKKVEENVKNKIIDSVLAITITPTLKSWITSEVDELYEMELKDLNDEGMEIELECGVDENMYVKFRDVITCNKDIGLVN